MTAETSAFSKKVRVRACGLLVENGAILLEKIHSPVIEELVWIPPGGGLEFGETLEACLKREFIEETNISVAVHGLVHINELINLPYHALEYYYEVERVEGEPKLGFDPELQNDQQLLRDLRWIDLQELSKIAFTPKGLLKKLQDWENRSSYPVLGNSI